MRAQKELQPNIHTTATGGRHQRRTNAMIAMPIDDDVDGDPGRTRQSRGRKVAADSDYCIIIIVFIVSARISPTGATGSHGG